MQPLKHRNAAIIAALSALLFYAFSSSHPIIGGNGYTGAPGDNVCASCHGGSNTALQGDVFIEGLPGTLNAGDIIPMTVRVTNPSLNAARAGYQLVALDNNNMPIGSITNEGSNSFVKTSNGRDYVGHQPARNFLSAPDVTFTFDYEVPANVGSATDITFYAGAIIANGANGDNNDRFVATTENRVVVGGSTPLDIQIIASADSPCFDPAEGSATANATGGTLPYNFQWSDGTFGPTNSFLGLGLNSVTVTDGNGDTAETSVTISSPPLLELDLLSTSPAPCDGQTGGSATVAATGGNGGYQYAWPGGLTGPSQSNLDVGNYQVTATDNNNCEALLDLVIDAVPIISTSPVVGQVSCSGGSDGSITLNLTGGTSPFDILWSDNATTEDRFGLSAGTYAVDITDDNGCTYTESFTLTAPSQIDLNASITDVSCFGILDGSISLTVSGGTPPYQFAWSNNVTSQNLNAIAGGMYDVTVTDNNNCTAEQNYVVNEPSELTITLNSIQNVVCFDDTTGSIDITVTGGTPPYSTVWNDGGDGTSLGAGLYEVTVTDANACITTDTYEILSDHGEITVAISTTVESGPGTMDGSANAIVVGGVPDYTYAWSTGDTTSQITNLSAGSYTLTLTDAVGCQVVQTVTIGAGDCLLGVTTDIVDNLCADEANGAITLNLVNGVSPTIAWSTGATTSNISNLSDGVYSVTITDDPDCEIILDSLVISSPQPLLVSIITLQTLECDGDNGILTYSVDNPSNLDSIIWSDGSSSDTLTVDTVGLIVLTAFDNNGCITTDSIELQGTDTVPPMLVIQNQPRLYLDDDGQLVDDPDGLIENIIESCTIESITLDYTLPNDTITPCELIGSQLSVMISATDQQGNTTDTSVLATITDTLAPMIVSSDTIRITNCDTVPMPTLSVTDNCGANSLQTTATLVDSVLNPGTYEMIVDITDDNGNTLTTSVVVLVTAAYSPIVDVMDVSCAGLSDGSFEVTGLDGYDGNFSVSATAAVDLSAGTYIYTVVDSTGCSLTDTVQIIEPAALAIDTFVINDASDSTSTNGSVGLQVSGGTFPYSYSWTDESGTVISTNSFIAAVGGGTYFIDITDGNGCILLDTFMVGDGSIVVSTQQVDFSTAKVYPNPARDILILEGFPAGTQVRLFDTNGQLVYQRSSLTASIDLDPLQAGVYIADFRNGDTRYRERIVIIK